jgi:hypothetical protein
MVRLFIDVGRQGRVGPSDIVGAIANEAGVPGRDIGAIDIHDRFTLVEIPAEYVSQVLKRMKGSRIRNYHANIRVAARGEESHADASPARAAYRDGKQKAGAGKRKVGTKPRKR